MNARRVPAEAPDLDTPLAPAAIRAHAMKNCVATIHAITQLIERDVSPAGQQRLQRMREAVERLVALVREELQPAVSGACCSVEEVFEDVRSRFLDEATRRQINLRLGGEVTLRIPMTHSEAAEALTNLVKNALEATSCGGRVTVAALALPGGDLQLRVSDTGAGMTAEQLAAYGEPYRTTKPGGMGVGIASTSTILARHGAVLVPDSTLGQGTCVAIVFRAAR